jgi:hypothetical protein
MSKEEARQAVLVLCHRHGMTVEQLSRYVLYDLCRPLPLDTSNKLAAVFSAAEEMLGEGRS